MRIALINGSPKVKDSSSGLLLEDLKIFLSGKCEVTEIAIHSPDVSEEAIEELRNTDAWVFAYPLYVDCMPAHLLSCLVQLEDKHVHDRRIHIYGIVNCGFYEGIQTDPALRVLQNWCVKAGFCWGGGIGVGGGGGLAMMSGPKPDKGPKAPVNKELEGLADTQVRDTGESLCLGGFSEISVSNGSTDGLASADSGEWRKSGGFRESDKQ